MKKAAVTAGACTLLAGCPGPATGVRENPEVKASPANPMTAAPCPPGSLQAMEQLGIRIGEQKDGEIAGQEVGEWVHLPEGETRVNLLQRWGQLRGGKTTLSGRLIFGQKRVWGHFTEATTLEGTKYPVCLEWQEDRKPDGRILTSVELKAVREFK
jgi:hypothetical protein